MRTPRSFVPLLLVVAFAGCDQEKGRNERQKIREQDVPKVLELVRQDIDRGRRGVREAADRMARGFLVEDPAQQEREMRTVMRRFQQPPRAINDLMVSPISFVAAVGADGEVIARDAEPDHMKGFDMGEEVPVVGRALEGEAGYELSELPSLEEGEEPSVTVIFAAPARHEGRVVGAMVAGLPLWRMAQQMSRQLQLEHAEAVQGGELIWALFYRGDELHYHAGFPPDLRELVPSHEERQAGLEESPGGYTGEFQQFGRWYGYGVLPLPSLGEDVGAVIFRSDPV
ncbi:MAG TPA: hypothetical protein RMH99_28955 [Sandaracinaceae bacterium LLY-WYZ-13_1]|nr:hypothetical protein [Sandaracinaceae bacterium LLY-WYZ-13_1]